MMDHLARPAELDFVDNLDVEIDTSDIGIHLMYRISVLLIHDIWRCTN